MRRQRGEAEAVWLTILMLLLIVGILFVAFLCRPPTSGTVIGKRHTHAYTTTRLTPVFGGKDTRWVSMPHYEPEKWSLCVEETDGEKKRSGWVDVTRELWLQKKQGGSWHYGEMEKIEETAPR